MARYRITARVEKYLYDFIEIPDDYPDLPKDYVEENLCLEDLGHIDCIDWDWVDVERDDG